MTIPPDQEKTGLGNYFVANYPPFSFWKPEHLPRARSVLGQPARTDTPLGLYLHIPFCRKRCKFCYFRVYTDKNARDIENYLKGLVEEVRLYSLCPGVKGRPLHFVYFGGGTPSYLSSGQLRDLASRLQEHLPWDRAQEVTFECEPGTLQQGKLEELKRLGVTRLSLGIENFDPKILEFNGRAHREEEIHRAFRWARQLDFHQINIDLIAGMVGETWENWRTVVDKTIALDPDSVTIYQMELPYNTTFSREYQAQEPGTGGAFAIADWPTKRAWVDHAFSELEKAGYAVSSAYTLVKRTGPTSFVYRDSLWHGADMLGTGVASFGHFQGMHIQNVDTWDAYLHCLEREELPLGRALPVGPRERFIREFILQMKTGRLELGYFRDKYKWDPLREFSGPLEDLAARGWMKQDADKLELARPALLQVDRLLPEFFLPEHRGTRYT